MLEQIKMEFEETGITVEIHQNHASLENLKQYIKDNFFEFYFGRNAIVVYQDIMATNDLDHKRKKLVHWLVKTADLSASRPSVARKVLENFKKQIKIKVSQKSEIYHDATTVKISQFDSRSMMIEVSNDTIHIVLNYIKTRFLFHLLKYEKEKGHLVVSTSGESVGTILKALIDKKTIAGKKILFLYNRRYVETLIPEEQRDKRQYKEQNSRQYSPDQSIRTYMAQLRESYSLLQLEKSVKDMNCVKKQYYKMAKLYHPDNYYQEDTTVIRSYEDKFLKVKEAYEIIKEYLERTKAA